MDPKFAFDNKVKAMTTLLDDIKDYPYDSTLKRKLLTFLEKDAINYLINELPEDQTFSFYCDQLDEYVVNHIKKGI